MNNPGYFPDTIAAIATAMGGGVGIIRLSGQNLYSCAQALLPNRTVSARCALYGDFCDAQGEVIDSGLMLYFPAPASFTGEDVIELHLHGGRVVLQMMLARCFELGARQANAGEFSQRAFLNGKMDLTQAEAVADLISATSIRAARMAGRSLSGLFSRKVNEIRDHLIHLRMLVEACLDFPEEEIDPFADTDAAERLDNLHCQLEQVLANATQGALVRDGIRVAIIGAPNVGKSSLFNALSEDDIAIVTDIAGTTRDSLRQMIAIDGIAVHLVDTAGLRDTHNLVEQQGIDRSKNEAQKADLVLAVRGADIPYNDQTLELLQRLPAETPVLKIVNKIDLMQNADDDDSIKVSAKTGAGLDILRNRILETAGCPHQDEGVFSARARHIEALLEVQNALHRAAQQKAHTELLAEELKNAQNALNRITGEFTSDDLLGEIFSRFCIGK